MQNISFKKIPALRIKSYYFYFADRPNFSFYFFFALLHVDQNINLVSPDIWKNNKKQIYK